MSNLSELLPTGGGQNAVDFVATGNLASGQAVALKADGTVEAITGVTAGVGAESVFTNAYVNYVSSAYDSVNQKVVVVYQDNGNAQYGTAVIGTVSGSSISFGTPVVYNSAATQFPAITFDSTNNKIVSAYYYWNGSANQGTAIVGTVSGTSISFGTAAAMASSVPTYISIVYDANAQKVVVTYRDAGNSDYGTSIVGTVSGTSISFGTAAVFNTANIGDPVSTYDATAGKVVSVYYDAGNANLPTAVVGTVSGTSISFGSKVVFGATVLDNYAIGYDSTAGKVVIAYRDTSNSNYGTAAVGTVSGTSISFGAPVVFESANVAYLSATFDSSANAIAIAYTDNGVASFGTAISGTVSGTSISFGSPVVFNAANTLSKATCYDSTAQKVVISYRDAGNSNYGTSVVFTTGSSNNTSFIGITSEAISNTATGAVNVYGGINAVQTGLTIASDYYVQSDGTLSTASASPAIKVGQAVSATTINMKDLT